MALAGTFDERLTTDRDRVRFAIGDTDDPTWLFADATIDAVLASEGSVQAAVLYLARGLIARFAQQPVVITAQGETQDYRDRLTTWQRIVDTAEAAIAAALEQPVTSRTSASVPSRATW